MSKIHSVVFVDLHLYIGERSTSKEELFKKFQSNIDYVRYLDERIQPVFIQHAAFEADFIEDDVRFIIKKSAGKKHNLFLKLFFEVKRMRPTVVMLHGMIQPWRIFLAKAVLGSGTKIIVQDHAGKPPGGVRLIIFRLADFFISRYLFVSIKQAEDWLVRKVIGHREKVFELMEGSTGFGFKDRFVAKRKFACEDKTIFLWVGRLDKNKDPMTILRAFNLYIGRGNSAQLWMIYGTTDLLDDIKKFIESNNLSEFVKLLGTLQHDVLEDYYHAADYFLLGSYYEGSGYALCEAMACGCIPIVTRIPSFTKMVDDGNCGYLFEPGNEVGLLNILLNLNSETMESTRERVVQKFHRDLSFQAIGTKISSLVMNINVHNN